MKKQVSNVLFLPGCSFEKHEKETSSKVFNYLEKIYDKAIYYKLCCGAISEYFNFKDNLEQINNHLFNKVQNEKIDLIIVQCANCYNYYKNNCNDDYIKEKIISIYEVLDEYMEIKNDFYQTKINVHDPCQARHCNNLHTAVRSLLKKMNYHVIDVKFSKNLTRCCGNGAMIGYTNQLMKRKFLLGRQNEFSYDIVTYCSQCQQTLNNSSHILKLIFYDEEI